MKVFIEKILKDMSNYKYFKNYVKELLITTYKQFFIKCSLPDFLIIGAQKCGTSFLYSILVQHPGIIAARRKEIDYFGNPYTHRKGVKWYASHFCTVRYKRSLNKELDYFPITGEATPFMNKPFVPELVYKALPSAKLIALFRDPVDRAFSHYQHNRRKKGREELTFEQAISRSPVNFPKEIENNKWLYHNDKYYRSYVYKGLYADHLERWYQYYPKERIHIISSHDLFENTVAELSKICQFLEIPDYNFHLSRATKHSGNYQDSMSDNIKNHLISVFRPHNRKLFELIGKDLGWPC